MWRLFDLLFPPRVDEIALRDVSLDDFLTLVSPRLVPETQPGTVALMQFSNILARSAIHEAKYHGSNRAFTFLGNALAEYLHDIDDVGFSKSDIIVVPVPLGKKRRKERGFNQAEEIARAALRVLDKSFTLDTNLLERVKETPSQVSLERVKREKNMRDAFKAPRTLDPARTYLILDDVLTTGATLQAAIDALKNAGAEHIIPLALAH